MAEHDKNFGKIIAVAGNQTTTVDFVRVFMEHGYRISYLLNVGPEKAHLISDYINLSEFAAALDISLLRPKTYAMNDEADETLLNGKNMDIVISVGWQRLFPKWFLERLSIGAFGMHGSAEPLPRGRGRSPMNWSIIEGRNRFLTSLFRYDEGVDSGMIVATQRFDIFPWDTIRSLQHKNNLAQVRLVLDNLPALLTKTATLTPQPSDVEPTYYPKREPEDGVIDWRDTTDRIYRLVRAVARPYPGAFTFCERGKVYIWEGFPFDESLHFDKAEPGEIVAAFHDRTFVVKCDDHTLYVTNWEGPGQWTPRAGEIFESGLNPSWEKLEKMYKA